MSLIDAAPAILDQGETSSCVLHSTRDAVLFAEMMKGDQANAAFQPSRLFMYYNMRKIMGKAYINVDSGGDFASAMEATTQYGVPDEMLWPFDPSKMFVEPSPEVYAAAKREVTHIQFAVPQTIEHLEGCIAEGYPLMIGVTLYASFESDSVAFTGMVPMPSGKEKIVGGHAMSAWGYDRKAQMFLVRNSWGYDWGNQGYCRFPYEYLLDEQLADDFRTVRAM